MDITLDECVFHRAAEIKDERDATCLALISGIIPKSHRLAVSQKIYQIYYDLLNKKISKKPGASHVVKLLTMILFNSKKVVERSPVKVKEVMRIEDEQNKEFVMTAMASDKILVTVDEDLIGLLRKLKLKELYGLEALTPEEAINRLDV